MSYNIEETDIQDLAVAKRKPRLPERNYFFLRLALKMT